MSFDEQLVFEYGRTRLAALNDGRYIVVLESLDKNSWAEALVTVQTVTLHPQVLKRGFRLDLRRFLTKEEERRIVAYCPIGQLESCPGAGRHYISVWNQMHPEDSCGN